MAHLIDKSALVAEIERILSAFENSDAPIDRLRASILIRLLSFIDTLEVKEVDLDNKEEWKNTGGFGSTWDPDSPDYCPD